MDFLPIFCKKAWYIVGDLFYHAIQEFFSSGNLLKKINHSVIVLVPKSSHAVFVGDFRPIACCNVIYKVIVKILMLRLALLLGLIIDHA